MLLHVVWHRHSCLWWQWRDGRHTLGGVNGESPSLPAQPVDLPRGRARRFGRFLRRLGPTGVMALAATVLPPIGAVVLLGFIRVLAPLARHTAWGPPLCVALFA